MFGAFTSFGKLGALASSVARAWSPAALWPTGTEAGMWIDPSNLTSQWQDSTGTTPVSTPGTVADSSNPVGLALDLRLGAPTTLGPELAANGVAAWTPNTLQGFDGVLSADTSKFPSGGVKLTAPAYPGAGQAITGLVVGKTYKITAPVYSDHIRTSVIIGTDGNNNHAYVSLNQINTVNNLQLIFTAIATSMTLWFAKVIPYIGWAAGGGEIFIGDTVSVKEIPGNHMLQATSTARPLLSAYDGQTLGPGDTYPSTGFPVYQKYDGTDDGMATATFAAGTLSNAMDCLIAVRRDSAANAVCGLYESVSDANKVFGIAESGSGSGCVGSGAGTPTVWVDGAQLTGGTAVTRGTLHTALSAGDWHILELRGLDLSTWTAAGSGLYTSYVLNGAFGGALLFPSSTSAADRDAARTWLGAKVGLTL